MGKAFESSSIESIYEQTEEYFTQNKIDFSQYADAQKATRQDVINQITTEKRQKPKKRPQKSTVNINTIPEDQIEEYYKEIINENKDLFSNKELSKILSSFIQSPTKDKLKDLIENEIPKRETLNENLKTLFEKYGINSLKRSNYLENASFERKNKYLKSLKSLEQKFNKINKSQTKKGMPLLYSTDRISKQMIKAILTSSTENIQNEEDQLTEISQKEESNFYQFKSTTIIEGIKVPEMSIKSLELYLEYYKETELSERNKLVENWNKIVEHEAKLMKELKEIFKNNPKTLKEIIIEFSQLDFLKKEEFLKVKTKEEKEKEKKNKTTKIELLKTLSINKYTLPTNLITKFKKEIEESKSQEEIEQISNKLKETIENHKKLNKDFQDLLNKYKIEINDQKQYSDEFFNLNSTEKIKYIKNLENKIKENTEIDETTEKNKAFKLTYQKVFLAISEENFSTALSTIAEYIEEFGIDKKIINLQKTILTLQENSIDSEEKNSHSNDKKEEMSAKEIEELISRKLKEKEDELNKENLLYKQILGQKQSEERSHGKIEAQERSFSDVDKDDQEILAHYYANNNNRIVHENQSEKITNVNISGSLSSNEKDKLERLTKKNSLKLKKEEGLSYIQLKNKEGKNISAQEAKDIQDQRLKTLSEKTSTDIEKTVNNDNNIIDINKILEERMKEKTQKLAA